MDRRRMMMGGGKCLIAYSLIASGAHNYIKLNGEGEMLTGKGEIEVKRGDFLLCYAYGTRTSIELDGNIVAGGENMGIATYEFYPRTDAVIKTKEDISTGIHIVITTG